MSLTSSFKRQLLESKPRKLSKTRKYIKLVNHLKFTYLDINEDFYNIEFRVAHYISENTYECLITNLA